MSTTNAECQQQSTIETPDGRGLHLRRWGEGVGDIAIVVVHGLGEHSGWYDEFGETMSCDTLSCETLSRETISNDNITTYAYDQHGHGKSPGVRGHASSLDRFVDDVQVVCDYVAEDQPGAEIVLLGHSMGGHITLKYLLRSNSHPVHRAIVTNPMILPKDPPTKAQSFAAWLTAKIIPRVRVSADIEPTQLTQDTEMLRQLAHDPLMHEKLSIGIGGELMSSGHEILEQASSLGTELLFLTGSDDEICDPETSRTFCERSGKNCSTKTFDGLRHSLLIEARRDEVFETIKTWLSQNTGR
ncbi:alpha/beta hydrolase [Rhodopirellula sallentina]|uniref:Lysophospholipase n=1 Tax=Rhodopirellula sallentina SM41 TaxID=1263870 RepID=M5UHB4_9BACT|nr:alpha/beta hydrolase [Rhodopirellula sallentina]EMI57216.1 lysophospholipase [Rhodopirellula sallentina SM41]